MYIGFPPFQSKKQMVLQNLIKKGVCNLKLIKDPDLSDLISNLIVVDPKLRWGQDDLEKIKSHKFFKNENFEIGHLLKKKSPLKVKENNDEINYEPLKMNLSDQMPGKFELNYEIEDFYYKND